ncbi:extracellular solute-binding protein [Paenibacillus sp. HWE-109]|uniref:DUF3502 domain-containing protein n=1 Tax=Paenibacillus sp. HWE-109 TaxID=1306526 RepID=UPI001EE08B2D|nr:DUF3502 domain-containing protein [Paenibacillus sp. HWE-109]UKS28009.1 extracellular solute-binding protein [Paenibacillus sp. HWE-109]
MVKKSSLSLLSSCVVLSIVMSGCSSDNKEKKVVTSAQPSTGASEWKLPLTDSGETLRIATLDNEVPDLSFTTGNYPVLQQIEQRTGVKLKWEVNKTDYDTVMRTRIAAASNLPDIIMLPKDADPLQLSENKMILKLNELIDQYAPHLKKFLNDNPDVRKALTAPDGSITYLPGSVDFYTNDYNVLGLAYRQDWVQKLGLSEPKTIDDWHTVLKAFKEKDPNGNGKDDEVPFVAGGIDAIGYFTQAYGMAPRSQWFSVDAKGKVQYSWTSPKAKQFLTEMNKWWKEGLIDQGMMTAHYDKAKAYVVSNIGGATSGWANRNDENNKSMQGSYPGANWVLAMPPKGPEGDQAYEVDYPVKDNKFSITKEAKNPKLAIEWLDYIFASDEGKQLFNFGVEGTNYSLVNGKPVLNDTILKNQKYPNPSVALAALGASRLPKIVMKEAKDQFQAALSSSDSIKLVQNAKPFYKFVFPPVISTSAESNAITSKMADIMTYSNEMQVKFIMGAEPLSNYDKFVEKLKAMGIDDVVKIKQQQYDRWKQN